MEEWLQSSAGFDFQREVLGYQFRGCQDLTSSEVFRARLQTIVPMLRLSNRKNQFLFRGQIGDEWGLLARITAATAKEVGLLKLRTGETVIRIGARRCLYAGDASQIISHSHPSGFLVLSESLVAGFPGDVEMLRKTGQKVTSLVGPTGAVVKWSSETGKWDVAIGAVLRKGF
jgi:hypothetical protein